MTAYERGYEAAISEAILLVANEPNLEGPMPLRNRILATFFPERSARAAGEAFRSSVMKKLRGLLVESKENHGG